MSNRKFVRADDTMKDSKETATAVNISEASHNYRERSFSLLIHAQIKMQENVAIEAYRSC